MLARLTQLLIFVAAISCGKDSTTDSSENALPRERPLGVVTVAIAAALADCVDLGPRQCLVVEASSNPSLVDRGLFYDGIDGFTFVPGVQQVVRLEVFELIPPLPPDSSSRRFEFLQGAPNS